MLNFEVLGVSQMLDSKLNLIFHFGILIFEQQVTTLQGHSRPVHPGRVDPARRVAGADEVARLRDGRRHAGARGRRHRGGRLHRQGRTFTCDIHKFFDRHLHMCVNSHNLNC